MGESCDGQNEPGDHAIGRSRGGPSTKIHLACDGHGWPSSVLLTDGNINDTTMFARVLDALMFRRLGPGRPATRPHRVLADKGYSSRANRDYLRRRGIWATIPRRRDQQANRRRRGSEGGRPPAFDKLAFKRRSIVERCFNRFKQYRAIATRYDNTSRQPSALTPVAITTAWGTTRWFAPALQ